MSYVTDYRNLLIKQYWEKTKARAEIDLKAGQWEKTYNWLASFIDEFDLDTAYGDRLDIIGKIVGINRIVPLVVAKIAFGFDENPNARGFDDKFTLISNTAPFANKFEPQYTSLELADNEYRLFIKARIAKNIGSPYMADDSGLSMQGAVNTLFNGFAYIVDNFDMTLSLYVSPQFDIEQLRAIINLNLLPKPQGVRYREIVSAWPDESFGFADNPGSQPFADKFDLTNQPGGYFAERLSI